MSEKTAIREKDLRPKDLMEKKAQFVEADRQYLLDRAKEWIHVNCPACGSRESTPYGSKNGFSYVHCDACETVYTNPRPNQKLLHDFYEQSKNYAFWNEYIFPATEETRRRELFAPRASKTVQYCRQFGAGGGTLLEVGAAFGIYCEEILKLDYFEQVVALEPTPSLAATCRRKGLETMEHPVEQLETQNMTDVVAAFEVLEHLFDPGAFITACGSILKDRGLLILSCPNVKGFDMCTLGVQSGSFDHEHLNYFHPDSLASLIQSCGFEVLEKATPGKLDAHIVREAFREGKLSSPQHPYLHHLLVRSGPQALTKFQEFLAETLGSSHMWVVARKI